MSYFCIDDNGDAGVGKTVAIAYQNYLDDGGVQNACDVTFYEGEEIQVELTKVTKIVPVKVTK